MKSALILYVAFAMTAVALANSTPVILNGDFSARSTENPRFPKDWRLDGTATEITLDSSKTKSAPASLRVDYKAGPPYAGVIQTVSAEGLRGKRLALRTHIARRGGKAKTGVWVGIFDKEKRRLVYRNSYETAQAPDEGWVSHVVEVDVPENAERILVGAAIYDADGVMWVDTIETAVSNR